MRKRSREAKEPTGASGSGIMAEVPVSGTPTGGKQKKKRPMAPAGSIAHDRSGISTGDDHGASPSLTKTRTTPSGGAFETILGVSLEEFFATYHEKKPLLIQRENSEFYNKEVPVEWSTKRMNDAVATGKMHSGTDFNIVRYDSQLQERVPLTTEYRVVESEEYDNARKEGWSVRFLRPHELSPSLSHIISEMEGIFGCFCGANTYWTPANSQGFAPHFDDVDVFLLQLEGEKRWRLYPPLREEDDLARISSTDYHQEELPAPTMDFVLKTGDMLYMPRGAVHQGTTPEHTHSLHITFSAYQLHTYGDLLKTIVERHIDCLFRTDIEFRRGLPKHWNQVLGAVNNAKLRHEELELPPHDPQSAVQRKEMLAHIRQLLGATFSTIQTSAEAIDLGVDQHSVSMISKRQPPPNNQQTQEALELAGQLTDEEILRDYSIAPRDSYAARMVMLDEEVEVIHCGNNSAVCLAVPCTRLRLENSFAPAIATILTAKKPVPVASLPMPDFDAEDEEGEEGNEGEGEGNDANYNRTVLFRALVESKVFVPLKSKKGKKEA